MPLPRDSVAAAVAVTHGLRGKSRGNQCRSRHGELRGISVGGRSGRRALSRGFTAGRGVRGGRQRRKVRSEVIIYVRDKQRGGAKEACFAASLVHYHVAALGREIVVV